MISETQWILIAITVVFTVTGILAALRTEDTKWPFIIGFFSILPVTVVLAWYGTGAAWRRWAIVVLVALYVARMLYTLLAWFPATGASKLKGHISRAELLSLPLVLVPVFCWVYPLPFFAAMDRSEAFGIFDAAALALYVIGTLFHFGSDLQKWRYKQQPESRGKLLRSGFWGISRHPNYFGDFLIYCSFAVVSVWPWGVVAPLANLLQYFFDAIPKNEKQSQARYGQAWDAYTRVTPKFLPLGSRSRST